MPRFVTFEDKAGKWRWRLVADNGRKIATSGESFYSRTNAQRAARNVGQAAGAAAPPRRQRVRRLRPRGVGALAGPK